MSVSSYSENAGRLISASLAKRLGIATPPNTWMAFAVQVKYEVADGASWASGVKYNNPLNLTGSNMMWSGLGQTGYYGGGSPTEMHSNFAAFGSLEQGCDACAANYAGGLYPGVVAAFKTGDPAALATAIQDSPWDSGHYGGQLATYLHQEFPNLPRGGDDMLTKDQLSKLWYGYFHHDVNQGGLDAWADKPAGVIIDNLDISAEHKLVADAYTIELPKLRAEVADIPNQINEAVTAATEPLKAQIRTLTDQLNTIKNQPAPEPVKVEVPGPTKTVITTDLTQATGWDLFKELLRRLFREEVRTK